MSDTYVYEESLFKEKSSIPFVKREITYVNDNNNTNYNGIIKFESSSTANSGKWASYSEGYIVAPIVIALQSSVDITSTAGPNGMMVGLKNGYYQFIHQVQVILENTTIIGNTPYTNFWINYKLMTTFSQSDVNKWGASLNFYVDSATSFQYTSNATATAWGCGLTNNQIIFPTTSNVTYATKATQYDYYNSGFLKRLQNTSFSPIATGGYGYNFFTSPTSTYKNYFTNNGGTTTAMVYSWHILARWRLKDLNSFFQEVPLLRGGFFKIYITTNTSSMTLSITGGTPPTMSITSTSNYSISGGATNPLMIASAAAGNPLNVVGATTTVFTIACGIASATVGTTKIGTQFFTSCRLYVPVYTLNDDQEREYTADPVKTIEYNDIIQYTISNVGAAGTINSLLTNNLANAQELVIIPYLNTAVSNTTNGTIITNQFESPFDSCPATTAPLAALTNLNVQISGLNIWQEAQNYEFDTFINEVAPEGAINGGQSTGLTSGLIDELAWSNAYRYYVVNLSRRLNNGDELIGKSYQITGKNSSAVALDLYCFISYKRTITLEKLTGFVVARPLV